MCFRGGGQRSMVKDHKITIFLGPFPYLKYRTQQVKIGKHLSKMTSLERGVPQGSIHGLLLYLVYTNKMAETLSNPNFKQQQQQQHTDNRTLIGQSYTSCGQLVTYADDVTMITSDKYRINNQVNLNVNLSIIESFLNKNKLIINVSKTTVQ